MTSLKHQRSLEHVDVAMLRASAFTGTVVTWWPNLDDDAAVRRWIAQEWGRPDIAEAVALASPVLAERVHHLLRGHRPAGGQARRLVLALGRYLVRMRGRPTPFGLFAGVAPARIGGHPSVSCTGDDSIGLRVDARWIADMIARLEALPALRRRLLVIRNDLAYVHGDRLVVSWQPHGADPSRDAAAQVSIRHTAVVKAALQHSGSPIAVSELVDKLAADRPSTPTPALDSMVGKLITHGVLITDLRPTGTTTDSLVHLLARLQRAGADDVADAASTVAQLRDAQQLLGIGPGQDSTPHALLDRIAAVLAAEASIVAFGEGLYEPETYRFGGDSGMDTAHELFIADSRHILQYLATADSPDYRREIAVRLATRLMTAAGLDFYEQGDVWRQVTDHRGGEALEPAPATTAAVHQLLTAAGESPTSPLTATPDWAAAFDTAGRTLAELARHGSLTRGLHAVLTDHLLFHLNRLGVSAADQRLLATAAVRVVFHRDTTTDPARQAQHADDAATVDAVTSDTTTAAGNDYAGLRRHLVQHIDRLGTFRTPQVKAAFNTVPRHLFLPDVDPADAYGVRGAVVTKRAKNGTAISSASSPNLVAAMLEQLSPQPGHRVLEIGAATGINAALLAELVGPTGTVVTIELDEDLADGARAHLTAAGYRQVTVVCGDGALGYAAAAPYDRIEVTAGAWDISTAWWDQLTVGGRIVVPLRLHGSGLTRSLAFDRVAPGMMVSTSAAVCGFVPMRGATEHGERHIRLAEDVILKVDVDDPSDEDGLARALTQPAHQRWTGIRVRHDEPAEHLDLWLATHSDAPFGRIAAGNLARSIGFINPAVRWAGAALYDDAVVSYLATRPLDDDTDELGIVTHGPHSAKLADQLRDLLNLWHTTRPAQPHITAHGGDSPPEATKPVFQVHRPASTLTISW